MRRFYLLFLLLVPMVFVKAQGEQYELVENINYYDTLVESQENYQKERCKLDVYYPKDMTKVPVVVWFHGGGLEGGEKHIPEGLKEKGVLVVTVNYRLHPKVKHPVYIEDAAAAVAWTFKNIDKYNGDKNKIFVTGHSAGGYLASMVGMDKNYLSKYNIDANQIAGLIPFSGHTITHFTIRKERGIPGTQAVIDKYAPLYHVRKDAPPMLLITGNREMEMLGRYEETAYFYRMMKVVGHLDVELMELDGYGHNMVYPAIPLLLNFVKEKSQE
ncbi:alpha/beta hydrolase [Maribacter sp. PR1]|uniref:Alpha/beta hydrolase n=1 Tax=Maribacter cobaltidurans TaxID=1178778 RepID=A0ABU7IQD2_9FLAO|nr:MULTISPECIES: alpha/beta hydrolase [Maribacter]MDC6387700.1 alpha/beta hydrolase [Maribacter sp. PR1]MEE1975089.1 alpha/beta hydrolase [Maribacter cobaltidurans]